MNVPGAEVSGFDFWQGQGMYTLPQPLDWRCFTQPYVFLGLVSKEQWGRL
jgi:hypothetical protein